MDKTTLLAVHDFGRGRLLGILDTIEKTCGEAKIDVNKVLAWRPAPGRAHIGWQAIHCAATHDRYLNVGILGGEAKDPIIVAEFGGGSTPRDDNVPTLPSIREALAVRFAALRTYIESLSTADLDVMKKMGKADRTIGESIILLAWHEAHHQGQIHLTWNMYKAAHGIA